MFVRREIIKVEPRESTQAQAIGQAAGYLGMMYWRGEAVGPDADIVYEWFSVGARFSDAVSLNGLGMMHLDGVVVPKVRKRNNTWKKICKIDTCLLLFRIVNKRSNISNLLQNKKMPTPK